ncbi:MAG: hypothetical protein JNL88_00770 [Bacteroidia bacterium]|nr:hypothetical protein [Bacteroidia bacterium]
MKKNIFAGLSIILLTISTSSYSQQNYKTALGLRLNGGAGLSVRHFLKEKSSIEGILYTRWRGLNITGLYNVNTAVFNEPGFNFFIGGGAHLGFWDRDRNPWWDNDKDYNDTRMVFGLDGQIGLEYVFKEIPLNLAVDWKPAFNIIGVTNFWAGDAALSVRYTFK